MLLDRTIQPAVRDIEQLTIEAPQQQILPNGVPLYVLNAGESDVVRIDIVVKGGRWQQSQPLQALLTNRMLREGTRRYTTTEIAERLDYFGAWLELSNASEYSYITLYSLNKYLPQTLDVLESVVKEPVFPEKELKVVVGNNLQQFQVNLSKVDFVAHRTLSRALYGEGHPNGRPIEPEDYGRISPEVLQAFYRRHYHSKNCSIYLSGKVDDTCIRRIEAMFGSEPFGDTRQETVARRFVPLPSGEKRYFVERSDAMQSAVRMGMLSLGCGHPDYLKLRVVLTLLGGYFGSRLMSNIREEKGYTYSISSGIIPYPGEGMLVVNTETDNRFVEPLIAEVYREIDRLQSERVTEEELTTVKNYMLGDTCRSYESAFSLADAWIFVHTAGLDGTHFEKTWRSIREITPEEIRDLAAKYLSKESLKEVISGKKMS